MRTAAAALRRRSPARIVVAVPVSAPQTCDEYRMGMDEIVCTATPAQFNAIGEWYEDFSQTTDEEVHSLLEQTAARYLSAAP